MKVFVWRMVIAVTGALGAGLAVRLFRGYPWNTTLYTALAVGALLFVGVKTFLDLRDLYRRRSGF